MPDNNPMKYMWVAEYRDGSVIEQPLNDLSVTDPSRSAFFDIQQDRVKAFILIGVNATYLVDLSDGHFEVNGIPFKFHESREGLSNFELVFFRRHKIVSSGPNHNESVVFRFGWKAKNHEGLKVERVMEIE